MLLKKNGGFELPILGLRVDRIVFDGMLQLMFDDAENSTLDLHGPFSLTRYGYAEQFHPQSKDAYLCGHDLLHAVVKSAIAGTRGTLLLTFENGWTLYVEDGPYENWHYTKQNLNHPAANLYVHGGVGQTYC